MSKTLNTRHLVSVHFVRFCGNGPKNPEITEINWIEGKMCTHTHTLLKKIKRSFFEWAMISMARVWVKLEIDAIQMSKVNHFFGFGVSSYKFDKFDSFYNYSEDSFLLFFTVALNSRPKKG